MPADRRELEFAGAGWPAHAERDEDAQQTPQCGFGCIDRNAKLAGRARPVRERIRDPELGGRVERSGDAVRGYQIEQRESVLRIGHWAAFRLKLFHVAQVDEPGDLANAGALTGNGRLELRRSAAEYDLSGSFQAAAHI